MIFFVMAALMGLVTNCFNKGEDEIDGYWDNEENESNGEIDNG